MPQGITGILYISLQSTKTQAPNLQAKPGEKHPVIPSKPSLFTQIGKDVPKLVNKTSDLIDNMQMAFSQSNRKKFNDTLAAVNHFAQVLAKNSDQMNQVVTKIDTTLTNINQASQDAPETMKSIRQSARSVDNAGKAANHMMAKGEKTVEFIHQQQLPALRQLTDKLNRSATTLDQLLKQLRDNPAMLVRGKQPAPLGPGER
jgi:phospholipid/cholesterol/gamma-HCH transport system substrate-binding protein